MQRVCRGSDRTKRVCLDVHVFITYLNPYTYTLNVNTTNRGILIPKGSCTQIVYTLAPKYPNRGYFKAKVCLVYLGTWTLRVLL